MRVRLAGTLNAFGYFGYATASAYGGQHFVFGTPRYRQCKMISHSAKSGPGLIDSHQHGSGDALVSKLHLALLTKERRVCCSRFDHPK